MALPQSCAAARIAASSCARVSAGAGAGGCAVPQLAKIIAKAAKDRTNEIDERFMINFLPGGSQTNPPTLGPFFPFPHSSGCDCHHASMYSSRCSRVFTTSGGSFADCELPRIPLARTWDLPPDAKLLTFREAVSQALSKNLFRVRGLSGFGSENSRSPMGCQRTS